MSKGLCYLCLYADCTCMEDDYYMSTQFTPGPWHAAGLENRDPIVYGPDKYAICDARTYHNHTTLEQAHANARLIAAAPELYAILADMESCPTTMTCLTATGKAAALREALAKVR